MKIPFGRYKNKELMHVADENPKYLIWLESVAKGKLKEELDKIIESEVFQKTLNDFQMSEEQYYDALLSDR